MKLRPGLINLNDVYFSVDETGKLALNTDKVLVSSEDVYTIDKNVAYTVDTIVLSAGDPLEITKSIMLVSGNEGPVILTSTPTILPAQAWQRVLIIGLHSVNTVKFQDFAQLPDSGLYLTGRNDCILSVGDTLELMYNSELNNWFEISRSIKS